jgi:pimeloyl-ACP methyl ester carboxylesterase
VSYRDRRMENQGLTRSRGVSPFAVAILSSPNGMSLLGYRHTPAYAAVIGQAVDFVRTRANLPVWLVGTSQGATAAVGGAARLGGKVAGIVVMSSVTGRNSAGESLFDSEPAQITVPVLIVSNTGDTCPASPPTDAPKIAESLTHSPRKNILYLESAAITGPPCAAESPHSYFGIEQAAVERVAQLAFAPVQPTRRSRARRRHYRTLAKRRSLRVVPTRVASTMGQFQLLSIAHPKPPVRFPPTSDTLVAQSRNPVIDYDSSNR